MDASAAMVQLKVLKGAGAAALNEDACNVIFACFSPPITMGPHDTIARSRDWQAEHVPPCSNMHIKGRGGPRIPGCDKYSTSKAMTWLVQDGQRSGTEHQKLTKAMRDFAKSNGKKNATLKQWMDKYEKSAAGVLKKRAVRKHAKQLDKAELAAAAARCIRQTMDASYKSIVAQSTPLRNGQAQGKAPPAPPSRAGRASSTARPA